MEKIFCENCELTLTMIKRGQKLVCPACDHEIDKPDCIIFTCPNCERETSISADSQSFTCLCGCAFEFPKRKSEDKPVDALSLAKEYAALAFQHEPMNSPNAGIFFAALAQAQATIAIAEMLHGVLACDGDTIQVSGAVSMIDPYRE